MAVKILKNIAILLAISNCCSSANVVQNEVELVAEYDFIVVGGGTGGCAVSGLLADGGQSVFLIEAGGYPHAELEIPGLAHKYEYAVVHPSVPQQNAALAKNGIVNYIYGKTLGGSSSVNGMAVNRASPFDYDHWASLLNDDSWNYANMLKYFKKFENYTGDFPSDQRGYDGAIRVSRPKYAPGLDVWLAGGQELGFSIAEPNGPQVISFAAMDYNKRIGKRSSSTDYITPHYTRNLNISLYSEAREIIFEGNKAIGVKYVNTNTSEEIIVMARKEIIVSAGVVGSAALLQKSGIGPSSVLQQANIPVLVDLPVGKNFHDHANIVISFAINDSSTVYDRNIELNERAYEEFVRTGDGPYSTYAGNTGQAFLDSSTLFENSTQEQSEEWADIHLLMVALNFGNLTEDIPYWATQHVVTEKVAQGESEMRWLSLVSRPKSRGSVVLNVTSIHSPPLLDFQYLSHPDDVAALMKAVKISVKLCEETEAYQKIGCRVLRTPLVACDQLRYPSDDYWTCFVKQMTSSGLHAAGTCRMGQRNDPEAVVDTDLRVIGVEKLRVVDTSTFPTVVNANTMTAVFAIAEKLSESILEQWRVFV